MYSVATTWPITQVIAISYYVTRGKRHLHYYYACYTLSLMYSCYYQDKHSYSKENLHLCAVYSEVLSPTDLIKEEVAWNVLFILNCYIWLLWYYGKVHLMQGQQFKMAGNECEFVEKPPKAFPQYECPICLLILREPYQATCCGKSFCKKCTERVKDRNGSCPTCKTENFFSYPNKGLEQSLYDFEVYCSHKSKGCEWRGELRELDKHLNSEPAADKSLEGCPFAVIRCPLGHTGCDVKLPRKDIKAHVNDNLLNHFLKQTAFVITLKAEKQQLEQHVAELEGEIKQMKEAQQILARTGQPIGPVEITMTDFKQYKDDEVWYSPPFYTNPYGYKMFLGVWPKGYSTGRGTHLGVSIHMMRGEFDDQLKWPFRGKITCQLLDQEEDEDHVVMTIDFNERTPDKYATRVTGIERSGNGKGQSKLLPLSKLEPKYLKNNCIKLCITKVVLSQ